MAGSAVVSVPTDVNISPIHPAVIKTVLLKIPFANSGTITDLINMANSPWQKGGRIDNLIVSHDSPNTVTVQMYLTDGTNTAPIGKAVTIAANAGTTDSEVDILPYLAATPFMLEGGGTLKLQVKATMTGSGNTYFRAHGGAYQLV